VTDGAHEKGGGKKTDFHLFGHSENGGSWMSSDVLEKSPNVRVPFLLVDEEVESKHTNGKIEASMTRRFVVP